MLFFSPFQQRASLPQGAVEFPVFGLPSSLQKNSSEVYYFADLTFFTRQNTIVKGLKSDESHCAGFQAKCFSNQFFFLSQRLQEAHL